MSTNLKELEKRLWHAADKLRANSTLSSFEYSTPVLGLIFLRYAWHRFKRNLEKQNKKLKETRDLLLPKLISGKIDVEKLSMT